MILKSDNCPWGLASAADLTGTFTDRPPTLTKPAAQANSAVIDLGSEGGGAMPLYLLLKPFGTDGSNDLFNVRVYGWDTLNVAGKVAWHAALICELAVTLGNLAGVAGTGIDASHYEADTIALTYGDSNLTRLSSPANDVRGAYAQVSVSGFKMIELVFDLSGAQPATGANALYRKL